ncbi:MAG: phage regulatory CII family protein [Neisseriaceae bacterium]|nr:phage regulatory CII family protein [Neisseriaceae bacterium]
MKNQYMHVERVVQSVMKGHRGGITGLANDMGKSPQMMVNKSNPNNEQNYLSLADVCQVIVLTGGVEIVDVLAGLIGRTTVAIPDGELNHDALMRHATMVSQKSGELSGAVLHAQSPESEGGTAITESERKDVEAAANALIRAGVQVRMALNNR